jgi:valyl-tRNA synthetase
MTAWTIDQSLKLMHPVMPFITEELWEQLAAEGAPRSEATLIGAAWPDLPDAFIDPSAESEIGWLVDLVSEIRALRAEMNVPPSAKPPLAFIAPDASTAVRIARHGDLLLTLGRVSEISVADTAPTGAVTFVSGGATAALSLAGIIDLAAERARLTKEIAAFDSDIGHVNKKLGNPNFVARAAPEVVEEQREKLAEAEAGKARLQAALARLDAVG